MVKRRLLLLLTPLLLVGLSTVIHGEPAKDLKSFAINDRIKTVGVCEEYNLNSLSASDKTFVKKYYPIGKRCSIGKRVGRCLGQKDPDGMNFDKHYYSGTAKGYDWEPSSIKVTCKSTGGKYEDG